MTDLTKIFSNFVSQATLQNFNDEMIFFSKMSMIDWCGVAYAAKEEPVAKIVTKLIDEEQTKGLSCLLYTSPSPRDRSLSRMPSSA